MGLIIIIMWLGSLIVLGTPGLVLGILVCAKAQRTASFWLVAATSALTSLAAQYAALLVPVIRRGGYSWDLVWMSSFGWHLLAPALVAAALWLVGRRSRQPGILGAVAGLLVSIPLGIGLAVPVFLLVPNLLNLHFEA